MKVRVEAFEDVEAAALTFGKKPGDEATGDIDLKKGQSTSMDIQITSGAETAASPRSLALQLGEQQVASTRRIIKYEHIPEVALVESSAIRVIDLELEINEALKLGYLPGSGDEVMEDLANIGYDIQPLVLNETSDEELRSFDVIITGIRAFNRNDDLAANHERLMEFVGQGGNVIAMYSTTYDLMVQNVGPYDLKLSRNRVTDETSDVNILLIDHPVFTSPNPILAPDWTGWVQERGLYFAGEWDEHYVPLIAWNDPGEDPQQGGLLVAGYGEGSFFYTGISFFRQLPAGVPGAYKLLVNMIEYQP
jgi:hypothetical protein